MCGAIQPFRIQLFPILLLKSRPFVAGVLTIAISAANGQEYPTQPIRIITSQAGGGLDLAARIIGEGLSGRVHQQVLVDNRRGGVIASEVAANATPDGYTLLINGSVLWLLQFMRDNVSWDVNKDFAPITLAAISPNLIVVHPSLPVRSVRELIALAKARPGELNYASGGIGGSAHLAAELFKTLASVNIVRVPYKGNGPGLTASIAGETQLMFPNAGSATPYVKSGKLIALAVTSARPTRLALGLPTVAQTVPGYEAQAIFAVFAPAKTPAAIVRRLNKEIVEVLSTPVVRERFFRSGVEVVGSSQTELTAKINSEMSTLGTLIRKAGIRVN